MIEVKDTLNSIVYTPLVSYNIYFPLENNVYMKLKLISLKFQNKELKQKCIQIHLIITLETACTRVFVPIAVTLINF